MLADTSPGAIPQERHHHHCWQQRLSKSASLAKREIYGRSLSRLTLLHLIKMGCLHRWQVSGLAACIMIQIVP
jgi:hypothetical protein